MILNDICEFIVDCPHTTAPDEGVGYPLIRTPNIGKGRLNLNGVHRVSEEVYRSRIQRGIPQDNDLIFAREAPPGNVAIVKNGEKVCLGQRTVLLRPDKRKVIPDYLVYYILAPKQQYKLLGTANGATVAHVNLSIIRNMPVELPSLDVQERIAGYISTFDNLIENNQKQIKLLEEAAQRLYKEWFVDLRFPGHEDVEIVDGLPEGWNYTTVHSFIKLQSGYAFKSKSFDNTGKFKIVTIKNVQDGKFDGNNVNRIVEIPTKMPSHCKLIEGDTLLSLTGNVGRICTVIGSDYLLNQRVAKIASDYPSYAYYLFSSKKMFHDMNNLANGAAQQNLSPIRTGQMQILKPSEDILLRFEEMTKPLIDKKILLNKSMITATQSRDRLLPKLMSGEIQV